MNWKIVKETRRRYADTSYYLKAERESDEGNLVLEISWIGGFYAINIELIRQNTRRIWLISKTTKRIPIFGCMVCYNDRIEKYGHQIMRITHDSPVERLKRLDSFQKDLVLNWDLFQKHNIEIKTTLPERKEPKRNYDTYFPYNR